jgi:hypothetical protein
VAGSCEHGDELTDSIKKRGISRLPERHFSLSRRTLVYYVTDSITESENVIFKAYLIKCYVGSLIPYFMMAL